VWDVEYSLFAIRAVRVEVLLLEYSIEYLIEYSSTPIPTDTGCDEHNVNGKCTNSRFCVYAVNWVQKIAQNVVMLPKFVVSKHKISIEI